MAVLSEFLCFSASFLALVLLFTTGSKSMPLEARAATQTLSPRDDSNQTLSENHTLSAIPWFQNNSLVYLPQAETTACSGLKKRQNSANIKGCYTNYLLNNRLLDLAAFNAYVTAYNVWYLRVVEHGPKREGGPTDPVDPGTTDIQKYDASKKAKPGLEIGHDQQGTSQQGELLREQAVPPEDSPNQGPVAQGQIVPIGMLRNFAVINQRAEGEPLVSLDTELGQILNLLDATQGELPRDDPLVQVFNSPDNIYGADDAMRIARERSLTRTAADDFVNWIEEGIQMVRPLGYLETSAEFFTRWKNALNAILRVLRQQFPVVAVELADAFQTYVESVHVTYIRELTDAFQVLDSRGLGALLQGRRFQSVDGELHQAISAAIEELQRYRAEQTSSDQSQREPPNQSQQGTSQQPQRATVDQNQGGALQGPRQGTSDQSQEGAAAQSQQSSVENDPRAFAYFYPQQETSEQTEQGTEGSRRASNSEEAAVGPVNVVVAEPLPWRSAGTPANRPGEPERIIVIAHGSIEDNVGLNPRIRIITAEGESLKVPRVVDYLTGVGNDPDYPSTSTGHYAPIDDARYHMYFGVDDPPPGEGFLDTGFRRGGGESVQNPRIFVLMGTKDFDLDYWAEYNNKEVILMACRVYKPPPDGRHFTAAS